MINGGKVNKKHDHSLLLHRLAKARYQVINIKIRVLSRLKSPY